MDTQSPKGPQLSHKPDGTRLDRLLLIGIATTLVLILGMAAANLAVSVKHNSDESEQTQATQQVIDSQQYTTTSGEATATSSVGSTGLTSEELVQVPNLLDQMEAVAKTELAAVGLGCDASLVDSPSYSWGHVVTHYPKGGTWVPIGTSVKIEVGGIEVPDVIGKHINDAGQSIGPYLLIWITTEATPNQADWNVVLAQDPAGGQVVPPASTVTLTLGVKPPINTTPLSTSTTKLQITLPSSIEGL